MMAVESSLPRPSAHIDGKSENKGRLKKKKIFFFDFIDYPTDRHTPITNIVVTY